MKVSRQPRVAVLLATYNGARFVEAQVNSLKDNITPFVLHWIDDHSTDNSRDLVRSSALAFGIEVREYHHFERLGFPGTFLQLIESVDADIYLFCDQDDIWQPGKIDATVADLSQVLEVPALCFSDCLMFREDEPQVLRPFSYVIGVNISAAMEVSRSFIMIPALGHTMGFTRPLRQLYLLHADIARAYAFGHDTWVYILAVACGVVRMLSGVPTTLWRRHSENTTKAEFTSDGRVIWTWKFIQEYRRGTSRQAEGFLLASLSLPPGPRMHQMISLARVVAALDRRHSPVALRRIIGSRVLWPNWSVTAYIAAACLCTEARQAG